MIIFNKHFGNWSIIARGATGRWCEVLRSPEDFSLSDDEKQGALTYDEAVEACKMVLRSEFNKQMFKQGVSYEEAESYCLDFKHLDPKL